MVTVNTTSTPTIVALNLLAAKCSPALTLRDVPQFNGWEALEREARGGYQYCSNPHAEAVLVVFDRLPYEGSDNDEHGGWVYAHTGVVYP